MSAAPAARYDARDQRRRAMIGKVKVAQKQTGMLDDDYRALLLRVAGRNSATECTIDELDRMLKEFGRMGFVAMPRKSQAMGVPRCPGRAAPQFPAARKARALWISLHQLGVVRDPSDKALENFACKQLGCTAFAWADQSLSYRLIEALKAMAERAGWSQDLRGAEGTSAVVVLKRRLVDALVAKLKEAGTVPSGWTLSATLHRLLGIDRYAEDAVPFLAMDAEQLDRVVRGLAELLARPVRTLTTEEIDA